MLKNIVLPLTNEFDIVYDIMDPKKIAKLRKKIASLRRKGGVKSSELESLASSLGKIQYDRGKEPTWIDPEHSNLRPLSIPHHAKELNRFTAQGILDRLESDLDTLSFDGEKEGKDE